MGIKRNGKETSENESKPRWGKLRDKVRNFCS